MLYWKKPETTTNKCKQKSKLDIEKNNLVKSKICDDAWKTGHKIQNQNSMILHKEEKISKRKIRKSA